MHVTVLCALQRFSIRLYSIDNPTALNCKNWTGLVLDSSLGFACENAIRCHTASVLVHVTECWCGAFAQAQNLLKESLLFLLSNFEIHFSIRKYSEINILYYAPNELTWILPLKIEPSLLILYFKSYVVNSKCIHFLGSFYNKLPSTYSQKLLLSSLKQIESTPYISTHFSFS